MSRNVWISLWAATIFAAFIVGATVGRTGKVKPLSRQRGSGPVSRQPQSGQLQALRASLQDFDKTLTEKDKKISELRAQLHEIRAELSPVLSPGEEERKRKEEEKRKRDERQQAREKRSKELTEKILQRKDRALRADALDELAALLQSENREDLLVGLATLPSLGHINCDKERFKPWVLAALLNDDAEVRAAASGCLDGIFSWEEKFRIGMSMVDSPSVEVRRMAADLMRWGCREDQKDQVVSAYRTLLEDEDIETRVKAIYSLGAFPEYAGEMNDVAIELSRNPEYAERMKPWLIGWGEINAKKARRLVEMSDQGTSLLDLMRYIGHSISDDAKPIISDYCFRVLREDVNHDHRSQALRELREMGDPSLVPELEEIARSPDAEGIEEQLAEIIEHLQQPSKEQR